jgi:hypothetical protein
MQSVIQHIASLPKQQQANPLALCFIVFMMD